MEEALCDKKFKSDVVMNYINKNFVTLKDEDMKKNIVHLDRVIKSLCITMKSKDKLFNAIFERIVYAGSYWDGLKVWKPEEFDLDYVMNLPINYEDALTFHPDESLPGYIKIKIKMEKMRDLRQSPRWSTDYKSLDDWVNEEGFIYQDKFRHWMEGVVDKALNTLRGPSGEYILELDGFKYMLSKKKSGPANTLFIRVPEGYQIDVDLVPVLEFKCATPEGFRSTDDYKKKSWLAVAKPLEGKNAKILWRLSFYEQERELIKGPVKPVIRQMKKMRDKLKFENLASYYIKTLFLWELESQQNNKEFSLMSQTSLFVRMLRKLCDACNEEGRGIRNFWCEKQNLLVTLSPVEKEKMHDCLMTIIENIDKQITENQFIIAKCILKEDEFKQMKEDPQFTIRTSTNSTNSSSSTTTLHHSLSTQSLPATSSNVDTLGPNKSLTHSFLHSNEKEMLGLLHSLKNDVDEMKSTMSIQSITAADTNKDVLSLLHSLKNDFAEIKDTVTELNVKVTRMENDAERMNNTVIQLCQKVADMESETQHLKEQSKLRQLESEFSL